MIYSIVRALHHIANCSLHSFSLAHEFYFWAQVSNFVSSTDNFVNASPQCEWWTLVTLSFYYLIQTHLPETKENAQFTWYAKLQTNKRAIVYSAMSGESFYGSLQGRWEKYEPQSIWRARAVRQRYVGYSKNLARCHPKWEVELWATAFLTKISKIKIGVAMQRSQLDGLKQYFAWKWDFKVNQLSWVQA